MQMKTQGGSAELASWDFTSIEPQIEPQKKEVAELMRALPSVLARGAKLLSSSLASPSSLPSTGGPDLAWLEEVIAMSDRLAGLFSQLFSYSYCRYSIETGNTKWIKLLNSIETLAMPLTGYQSRFVTILNQLFDHWGLAKDSAGVSQLLKVAGEASGLREYAFFLVQSLEIAKYRMAPELEELAGDLQRNAGDAWDRLHSSLSSKMQVEWNPITHETKTMVELRNLAHHPQRHIRKKAHNLELKLWQDHETSFAAALNGVKGNSLSLYTRRGYEDFLQPSTQASHITRKTLNSLIAAMEESRPMFRRYFNAKAGQLGLQQLSFYDLMAPIEGGTQHFSYEEARDFIIEQFSGFSQDLGDFAQQAFDNHWIDADAHTGKVGGAYMTDFPLSEESRILINFDGTFDSLATLAHELGHGYHSAKLKGFRNINREYPMTLAETASTFCETIVYTSAMNKARGNEKLAIIEHQLLGSSQIIVDILSRFYFEKELFTRRKDGDLSPGELCAMMTDAQQQTYGNSLNEGEGHPYMWAVKGHYYGTNLAFYNYPYAFGQIFALGLYARYTADPEGFPQTYTQILQNTGTMSAEDLCAGEGFNIEDQQFWQDGLAMLDPFVKTFEEG